jgi:hypothetical protein
VRKREDETSDKSSALRPPSEAWLLRTLAELRREQRHPFVRTDRVIEVKR